MQSRAQRDRALQACRSRSCPRRIRRGLQPSLHLVSLNDEAGELTGVPDTFDLALDEAALGAVPVRAPVAVGQVGDDLFELLFFGLIEHRFGIRKIQTQPRACTHNRERG